MAFPVNHLIGDDLHEISNLIYSIKLRKMSQNFVVFWAKLFKASIA